MANALKTAIGLGSNLGDRLQHLRSAVTALGGLGEVVAVSPLYETEPVGDVPQGPYLNAAAVLETTTAPVPLLAALLAVERGAGRERRVRWGPRTLDLDLLVYGGVRVHAAGLVVPHPRMLERRFVLEPLLDAWPDVPIPSAAAARDAAPPLAMERVAGPEWAAAAQG